MSTEERERRTNDSNAAGQIKTDGAMLRALGDYADGIDDYYRQNPTTEQLKDWHKKNIKHPWE